MDGKKLYRQLREQEMHYSTNYLGCGMLVYKEVVDGYWRTRYLLNVDTCTAYEIVGLDLRLKSFTIADVETEHLGQFEHSQNAINLAAYYPFEIYSFKEGVAYVSWTLHPDGMYFMDEDGYGMEPCDKEEIGAYIDTHCRVFVKFRNMYEKNIREKLYQEALKKK